MRLIVAMVRTGVLGYGGGPAIIPLIRHEAVNRYEWLDDEEFAEILALANTLPGPLAPKMASYLGYRLKGTKGAIVGILAIILPTSLAMILLLGILTRLHSSPVVQGMIAAVNPVIVAMLAGMTYDFAKKAHKALGLWVAMLFGGIAFVLLELIHVPMAIVVLVFLMYGSVHLLLMSTVRHRWTKKGE
ncbi:chromate transporter [Alicyclobacillus mengziensis]|uniref:Chromate transporter n=1 Tax=Alicyclobacillus mengziensis TaxID=2931921 RepID=A0A9X7Z8G1_9BACL|nr:chromate transporter [Alicyclobacillus mengziensis]QSO48273.1 chromate transporter [Alicyclobacillus mengziensis]